MKQWSLGQIITIMITIITSGIGTTMYISSNISSLSVKVCHLETNTAGIHKKLEKFDDKCNKLVIKVITLESEVKNLKDTCCGNYAENTSLMKTANYTSIEGEVK